MRFPEFSGEWIEMKLVQITSKIGSGKTPKGGEEVYTNTGIPFIRSQNVINDSLKLDSTHIPQDLHESMNGSKVLPNDILLNITGGSIGRSCVVPEGFNEGNVNQHVSIIRLKNDNPRFLQPILSSWRGQKLVFQRMTGSGREGLNFESIKGFKINLPSVAEQNKIASLLTVLDERIQTQNKIIEDYKSLKKGMMQKLFSQEFRFKDESGNAFPNWKETTLGDVSVITMGQSPDSKSYNIDMKGIPLIQGNADILNRISNPRQWTDKPTKICEKGDLLLTVRAPVGAISKSNHQACIGRGVCAIKSKKTTNQDYIYQLLLWFEPQWVNFEQGSTFTAVSGNDIRNLKIFIPSMSEQNKIAATLSAIDEKIKLELGHLAILKIQKQYFLQNLFI